MKIFLHPFDKISGSLSFIQVQPWQLVDTTKDNLQRGDNPGCTHLAGRAHESHKIKVVAL